MSDILPILSRLDLISVVDILLVAFVFYWVLSLIQGTQAVQLLRGILILSVLAAIAASAFHRLIVKALDFPPGSEIICPASHTEKRCANQPA